jgi:hypothetical protein
MAEKAEPGESPADESKAQPQADPPVKRPLNLKFIGVAVGLVAVVAASVVFSFRFVEDERARQLQA